MKRRRAAPLKEEELHALRQRLAAERLEPGDYERLREALREAKRLRRQLGWMDLAQRILLRMLAVKNWVRRCQGKAPLVVEEGNDDEC
jgi:hypothetical protein